MPKVKYSKLKSKDDQKASLEEATQKQEIDLIDADILSSAVPELKLTEMFIYAICKRESCGNSRRGQERVRLGRRGGGWARGWAQKHSTKHAHFSGS